MLDENEFLSPYGIRALSKFHDQHPYVFYVHGQAHTVVGILPPGFSFLMQADLLKPIAFKPEEEAPSNHGFEYLVGLARLKPGVTFSQARSQMDVLVARLRKEFYDEGWGVTMTPLLEEMTGDVRPALMVLLGAVGCLLLLLRQRRQSPPLGGAPARDRAAPSARARAHQHSS
jgi:putative ABC transport system permease protein